MAVPQQPRSQSVEEVHHLLLVAVRRKQPVSCIYEGLQRRLCPHVLGTNRAGQKRVFCYQYGGDSRSGLQPRFGSGSWRCLAVEKLKEVELLNETWQSEPRAQQRCVDQVEAVVDQPDELQKGQ